MLHIISCTNRFVDLCGLNRTFNKCFGHITAENKGNTECIAYYWSQFCNENHLVKGNTNFGDKLQNR